MKLKSTGIVRKIDDLGRIVLPAELRRTLDMSVQDSVEIYVETDHIVLKKHMPSCHFCGCCTDLKSLKGKYICSNCLQSFS